MPKVKKSKPQPADKPRTGTFIVRKDTPAQRRTRADPVWRLFVTDREMKFTEHGLADNGGNWAFDCDGFEMKLPASRVDGRDEKGLPPRSGVCRGGVSGPGGGRTTRKQNGWGK
jgi:hypothetical protein